MLPALAAVAFGPPPRCGAGHWSAIGMPRFHRFGFLAVGRVFRRAVAAEIRVLNYLRSRRLVRGADLAALQHVGARPPIPHPLASGVRGGGGLCGG